ncbi:MAG: carboxymuconolactone decarboxylase family protein [Acidobacteriaceae bacterium]
MPRISRLGRNDVSEAVGEIYDRYMRQRGNVPNMFRTVAHRPRILETMIAHMEAVLNTGTLPTKLKELVIVRTSQMNACEYCLASHSLLAKKLGYSAEQIEALPHFEERTDFTEGEKAALRLAERLTRNERPLTEPELAELKRFFDEGEIVELMAASGLFNYFNRFNNLLAMEPTAAAVPAVPRESVIEPQTNAAQ